MNYIYISIIILLAVVLIFPKSREKAVGICKAAVGRSTKRRENIDKALAFLQERGEASNSDISEYLGVTGRTVVRYMDELESEGKVEQVGNTGRSVTYRLKQ